MIRDIEIECLEKAVFNKIFDGYNSNQDVNVELSAPLYYAFCNSNDTYIVVSEDINKLYRKCISHAMTMWMPPNTIMSSSHSELIFEGDMCHLNLYDAVKDSLVDGLIQNVKNIVFDAEEVEKNFIAGKKAKKPCYYFSKSKYFNPYAEVIGCTVEDAVRQPNKVIEFWFYWCIANGVDGYILDEYKEDVIEDLIPNETQKIVKAIVHTDSYYSINLSGCDIHFY